MKIQHAWIAPVIELIDAQPAPGAQGPWHGLGIAAPLQSTLTEAFDDGWGTLRAGGARSSAAAADAGHRGAGAQHPRPNDSPDIGFDLSINPYRGCEHGCIYCYARPTHSYLNLSPGIDFETRIVAKVNAAERLREAFARRGYEPQMLNLGSATDAYQPAERRLRITRAVIEVLAECRHAFSVITKSAWSSATST